MRFTKVECFILRLSSLELRKESFATVFGLWDGAALVKTFEEDFARIEGCFEGAVGAW